MHATVARCGALWASRPIGVTRFTGLWWPQEFPRGEPEAARWRRPGSASRLHAMLIAPLPPDEAARLQCLRSLEVLDTPPDPALDAITQALALQLGCPIALVSLVDAERQWFKSRQGLEATEISRDFAFCAHAILGEGPFIVADTLADPRFADNPLVTAEPHIRFYAGEPLKVNGQTIGTLCAFDHKPRLVTSGLVEVLRSLARAAEACLQRDWQLRRALLSEARLADFAQASSDFLWECDDQRRLTWLSPNAGAELSADGALLIGTALWDGVMLDPMGQAHPLGRTLHEALAEGQPFARRSIEVELSGGCRVLSFSGVPVLGPGGVRLGWRGSVRDVSAAVRAQRSLRERDDRLQRIASHVPGVLYQFEQLPDGRMRFPYASGGLEQVYELTPGEVEVEVDAGALFARMHPEDMRSVQANLGESARRLEPWRDEFRVLLPKLGVRWLEGHATPQPKTGGGVVWHGFVADVTERRAAMEALDQSRRRLQLAMDAARMGIVQVDPVAGTIEFDPHALQVHQLAAGTQELVLWRWLQGVDSTDHEAVQAALAQAMADAEAVRVVYGIHAGFARRIELVLSRRGGDDRLLGVCRDVTEQERAEEALRQADAAALRRRDEVEFLARASHELRTPMNAILGFTQLLCDDTTAALAPHQRRWLEQMRRGGEHLLALIEDVLSLASADEVARRLAPTRVSLQRVLQGCIDLLEPLAAAADVRFPALEPGPELQVTADRRTLRQVLVNVLGNAVKYNRRGGAVTIGVRRQGGVCVVDVNDDGPGIAQELFDRLFLPFERLGAEFGNVPGTGLGLSIAKSLTEAMGGRIEAHCPSRGGTCVRISLPLAYDDAAAEQDTGPAPLSSLPELARPKPGSTRLRRAVYVEDDEVNRLLMGAIFEQQSHWSLQVFEDATRALVHIREHLPDLVLLDLTLPGLSGAGLLQMLREDERTAALCCIAVSADALDETLEAALEAGFDDFWVKPLKPGLVSGWLTSGGRWFDTLD